MALAALSDSEYLLVEVLTARLIETVKDSLRHIHRPIDVG
jgi:hypothetical protein